MNTLNEAKRLFEQQHYFDALLLVRANLLQGPADEVVWLELGIACLLVLNIPEQTEPLFQRLCYSFVRDKDNGAAETSFQRAIQQLRNSVALRMQAGVFFANTQNWNRAEECFRAVLTLDAYHPEAWHRLGEVLLLGRRIDEAFLALLQSVKIDPLNPAAHEALNRCYQHRGQPKQAGQHAARAQTLRPFLKCHAPPSYDSDLT